MWPSAQTVLCLAVLALFECAGNAAGRSQLRSPSLVGNDDIISQSGANPASGLTVAVEPQHRIIDPGLSVTLTTVISGGTEPVSYQWRRNGTSIVNATNSTLSLTNVQEGDSGFYTVEVEFEGATIVSEKASLYVTSSLIARRWTLRGTLTNSAVLLSVTYGKGRFVATGRNAAFTSTNGLDWTVHPLTTGEWRGVAYGGDRFAAVSRVGNVIWSENGETWFPASVPGEGPMLNMSHAGGRFFAAGDNGRVLVSSDAESWDHALINTNRTLLGTTWGNGLFVVVGDRTTVTSTDAQSWVVNPLPIATLLYDVVFGEGKFIAVAGSSQTLVSVDGVSWSGQTLGINQNGASIAYGGGVFVGADSTPPMEFVNLRVSDNGVLWTTGTAPVSTTLRDVTYGDGTFVAVGDGGVILESEPVIPMLPRIEQSPRDVDVRVGGTLTNSVIAFGAPRPRYQWRVNGTNIPGATNATLIYTDMQFSDAGDYSVIVFNAMGAVISGTVQVRVVEPPAIMRNPESQFVLAGAVVALQVEASGTMPLGYRWRRNAVFFTTNNQNSPVFVITNAHTNHSGNYTVAVTNSVNSAGILSAAASLIVFEDLDQDGMGDGWERSNGLNPAVPTDGLIDSDGDGFSNVEEFTAGTDPMSVLSYLRFDSPTQIETNRLRLSFMAVSNRSYSVLARDVLATGEWSQVMDVRGERTNRVVASTNIFSTTNQSRFYRLRTPRLP